MNKEKNPYEIKIKGKSIPLNFNSDNRIYVAIGVDNSGSIDEHFNTKHVIKSHNKIVKNLQKSVIGENIFLCTETIGEHKERINNWTPLKKAKLINKSLLTPKGETPLYDNIIELSQEAFEKKKKYDQRHKTPARYVTVFISDGVDTSSQSTPDDVKWQINKKLNLDNPFSFNRIGLLFPPNVNPELPKIEEIGLDNISKIDAAGWHKPQLFFNPREVSTSLIEVFDSNNI